MDERVIRRIQQEGAEALLDAGVSVPLKEVRRITRSSIRYSFVSLIS